MATSVEAVAAPATATSRPSYTVEAAAAELLDAAAREGMDRLFAWATTRAADYGVRLERAVVRQRQSIEDKAWVDVVVEFSVTGSATNALRFWAAASEKQGRLVRASSLPVEMLAVSVDWQ